MRRRRTCNPQDISVSLGSFVRDNEDRKKKKRKLSPFPEVNGRYVMEEAHRPAAAAAGSSSQLSGNDAVTNLTMTTSCCNDILKPKRDAPVFIKPSEVMSIERKMANVNFAEKLSDDVSIWDSVVAWMRSAVEFIGLETTPTAGRELESASRKRPLRESNVFDQNDKCKPRPVKKGRRMTLGPGVLERRRKEQLHEGVGLQILTTPIKNTGTRRGLTSETSVSSTSSLLGSAHKQRSLGAQGLNEVTSLNSSKIRNPSLRRYYIEEKTEPTLRRSPRLAAKQESLVPPAPPPPPPPPPKIPSLPPPPPPISKNLTATPTSSPSSVSRCTLQQMQSRLRNRMMKKGNMDENRSQDTETRMNPKANQWAELQARKRKMSLNEFSLLANKKKNEVDAMLKRLQLQMPSSMEEMKAVVEEVQDASQWFSGGSKEMKEEFPLYKSLEHKLDLMTECVQIQSEMVEVVTNVNPLYQRSTFADPHTQLDLLRGDFYHRHKQWGQVLTSNAKPWYDASFPVDPSLIQNAKLYLASVVLKYVDVIETESTKVGGVMCSIKSRRVSQIKEFLKGGICLVTEVLAFSSKSMDSCPCSIDGTRISPCCACVSGNLDRARVLTEHFVNVCLMEFNGHVSCLKRQDVCEHFEAILKVLSSLKGMISKFTDLSNTTKKSGIMSVLSRSDRLSNLLYTSCVKLIQHIECQSKSIISLAPSAANSREIVLWMMFGCKYVNLVLEVIGTKQADEKGLKDLLQKLQKMEALLPDY